jgi:glycosyltransferase involved in cell wall biosynthesis
MKAAVLIPCYNEAATIAKVVADYRRLLPEATVFVYDNNSSDGSAEAAAAAGAVVTPEYRQGKGFVVRSMFREVDADIYLMVDGDDTYAPEDVVALARPVSEGHADMVIGDRLSSTYFRENKRLGHGMGNRLVRWLINSIFDAHISDIMTGARAFSRDFVKSFPVLSAGFEVETEMTVHALDKDFLVVEMPVTYRDRPEGSASKLNTLPDGARVLKTVIALFKDFRPLLFSGIVAGVLLFGALLLFLAPFNEYVATGYVKKVPSLVVAMALGLSSLLALVTGALLDSIRKQSRMLYELELNRLAAIRRVDPGPEAGESG